MASEAQNAGALPAGADPAAGDWAAALDRAIDGRFEQMVQLRRHLHMHPEVSGEEVESSLHLYQLLGDEGLDVRLGLEGRGVIADPRDGDGRPMLALRGDLDALRIHERNEVPYRSRREGVMHACGHDAHTALVFGALAAVHDLRRAGRLPWAVPLRGIFQPSEEVSRGAREMIEVGALDGVGAIVAAHMDPMLRLGRIGLRSGVLTAHCDEITIRLHGLGGHAARPHEAHDPIAAAAQFISAIYLFIPRVTNTLDGVVVTIGQIFGGEMSNVIPEMVTLRGTVRSLDSEVRVQTFEHIRRLAQGIGQTSGTEIEVEFGVGSPAIINDRAITGLLHAATVDVLGDDGVTQIARPSMGSEDFSFYLERVPGAMVRIGSTSDRAGGPGLHSPRFDIDEEALRIAVRVLARTAIRWAQPGG